GPLAALGRCHPRAPHLAPARGVHLGPRDPGHRAQPDLGAGDHDRRGHGIDPGLGLHALLRHELHLHGPCGRRGLSRPHVQHRRRGAGRDRGPRRRARGPLHPLAALEPRARGRLPRRRDLRRGLGGDPRLARGQAGQPHRHHDDHVQLHRRGAPQLPARGPVEAHRHHGDGDRPLPGGDAYPVLPRPLLLRRDDPVPGHARQHHLLHRRPSVLRRLGPDLEDAPRLRDPGLRPFRGGRALRGHRGHPHHHDLHADLRRPRGPHGDQQHPGRGRAADPQRRGGRGLHRHRRGADGPQPPAGRVHRRHPLRRALPRRGG
ncbi:MAG: Predicted nucleoside ABC transporter, permease 1 component, partial [uncultured Rubellimicrobium sp.]